MKRSVVNYHFVNAILIEIDLNSIYSLFLNMLIDYGGLY